jgi:hypothetical protein
MAPKLSVDARRLSDDAVGANARCAPPLRALLLVAADSVLTSPGYEIGASRVAPPIPGAVDVLALFRGCRKGPILDARRVRLGNPVDGRGPVVPDTETGEDVRPAAFPIEDMVGR